MARVLRIVAALLLALWVGQAVASFPPTTQGQQLYSYYGGNNCNGMSSWQNRAISEIAAGYAACWTGTSAVVEGSSLLIKRSGSTFALWSAGSASASVCPANSTASGPVGSQVCTCTANYSQTGNACFPKADTTVSELNNQDDPRVWVEGGAPGTTFCKDGIAVSGSSSASTYDGKQHIVYGPFTSTGAACGPGDKPIDTSVTCASGTFPGTVNGVQVCAPRVADNTVAQGPTTTASAPSSGASSPQIPGAPASATSSSTSTSCNAGTCTTTTTYKDGNGTSVGAVQTQQPRSSWCAENPTSSICGPGGTFSGSCGSPPACTGDAVQCAIATQAFEVRCALAAPTGDEGSVYDEAKTQTGDQTGDLPGNETFDIGPDRFDRTELFGAAQGMQDMEVSIAGASYTLRFSSVNYWLELLGYLNMGATFLLCARIVVRG